ncbi:tetratricopeptide repeat protein [Geobacter argillaceus]|uniref:Tetratricopeptide repeat protein n=2 Tax=Geobacter argillaceus TaxID=345631 RepID=A0A562WQW8_9BACT|nr:tetratricopeptide repeat protein [Geobacter argillaceus]
MEIPGLPGRYVGLITGTSRRDGWYRLALIVIAGLLAYANSMTFPFTFDDMVNIMGNPQIKDLGSLMTPSLLKSGRALGVFSFALNYRLHGDWVVGYHLVNLFVHLSAALTLYGLITLLWLSPLVSQGIAPPRAGHGRGIALFAALLFVSHPVQTQAVTYIVQRFTSLATLFYLLAAVCYVRARLALNGAGSARRGPSVGYFALAFLAALLSMRTKEIAFTLPLMLIFLELLCFRGTLRARLLPISLFLMTMAIIPLSLVGIRGGMTGLLAAADQATRVQTIISRTDYLLTQFRVVATYLRLLIFPVNQNLDYEVAFSHTLADPAVLGGLALHLALLGLAVWCVVRSRPSASPAFLPAPHLRLVAIGIGWFYIALLVESSVIPIIDPIFEHRVYLPSAGAFLAISSVVIGLAGHRERVLSSACLAMTLLCLVFAVATVKRNRVWSSEASLWEDVTRKSPNLSRPWNNLGYAYLKRKEPARALPALIRSISLDPGHPDAWNNVGLALTQLGSYLGRFDRTVELFRDLSAVNADAQTLWFAKAHNNLGLAYDYLGRPVDAIASFRKSLDMDPDYAPAHYNMGLACLATGDQACVIEQYLSLVQLRSGFAPMLEARMRR